MEKAIIVFSGGIDSICMASYLKSKYELYGISFSYGQRAKNEIKIAKLFANKLGLRKHKIIDISFMKDIYGDSNVLTNKTRKIPSRFEYSIVVPIRNAIFLTIASAWAFRLNGSLVAFGAHTGDTNYPDCRPIFSEKLQKAINQGEIDGIEDGIRNSLSIWSPYAQGFSKSDLIKIGQKRLGAMIFRTWSCYDNKKYHCGLCESCRNRKAAFLKAGITDETIYLN